MATNSAPKQSVTIRLPRQIADEVRSIAEREDVSSNTIYRKLLRRALQQAQRDHSGEAA